MGKTIHGAFIEKKTHLNQRTIEYEVDENNCWNCVSHSANNHQGYKMIKRREIHMRLHRYIYLLTRGFIRKNMPVLHTCNNRDCINPKHLRQGTQKENIRDKYYNGTMGIGEKNPANKITESEAEEILERARKGKETHKEIAEDYDIHWTMVSKIKTGKKWSHLQEDYSKFLGNEQARVGASPKNRGGADAR